MSEISFKLPVRAIKDEIDNSANEFVKHVMAPRKIECLEAVGEVLEENNYLPDGTTWYVENELLYFSVYMGDSDEDLAHYFWEGQIYGPNIPTFDEYTYAGGRRWGIDPPKRFFSPKGQRKYPTGRYLEQGPDTGLGVQHWTEAVEPGGELFDEVVERCEEILRR